MAEVIDLTRRQGAGGDDAPDVREELRRLGDHLGGLADEPLVADDLRSLARRLNRLADALEAVA